MKYLRIFAVWLIFVFAVLVMMLGFEFVNKVTAESGFSSGEVFAFEQEGDMVSGEIFGKSFSADISPVSKAAPWLDNFALLLPPNGQLLIKGIYKLIVEN